MRTKIDKAMLTKPLVNRKPRFTTRGTGGPGRPRGAKNKIPSAIQECLQEAFNSEELGGVEGLIKWAVKGKNREAFYKMWIKLIPRQPAVSWDLAINTKPKVDLAEVLRKSDEHLKELEEQLEEEERPARLRRGFE